MPDASARRRGECLQLPGVGKDGNRRTRPACSPGSLWLHPNSCVVLETKYRTVTRCHVADDPIFFRREVTRAEAARQLDTARACATAVAEARAAVACAVAQSKQQARVADEERDRAAKVQQV